MGVLAQGGMRVGERGAGGPRWVEVAPERFVGWVESFAQRHGATSAEPGPEVVVFRAADGAVAECHVPFPPLRLAASKVGSRLVHGRSAAGGQSQQRFARRREKQAANALAAAADTAVAVFGPHLRQIDAVVLGGDRRAVAGLRGDPRLGPYFDRAVERFLTVPDPRLAVLRETPTMFRSGRIRITDGEGAGQ